jgi:hypothetical protein
LNLELANAQPWRCGNRAYESLEDSTREWQSAELDSGPANVTSVKNFKVGAAFSRNRRGRECTNASPRLHPLH